MSDGLSHCVTALCEVAAHRALAFLADGLAVGRWALGCMNTASVGDGVYRGISLFDGSQMFAMPVAHAALGIVEFHVGAEPTKLVPRIIAKVVSGPEIGRGADQCLVSLIAWRDAAMSDDRWRRLCATHEAEIYLLRAQIERGSGQ